MRTIAVFLLLAGFTGAAWGNSNGVPAQLSGVPGEGNCSACHGTANTGQGSVSFLLVSATAWTPGQPVKARLTLNDPSATRWGFQLTARATQDPARMAGSFRIINNYTQLAANAPPGFQYVTHTLAGTFPGVTGSASWEVEWTPPSDAGFGAVSFYITCNGANGNEQADSGDRVYTAIFSYQPSAPSLGVTRVLPQLAFGSSSTQGNWSTSVYLHNTTPSPVVATVRFFDADGSPLAVPGIDDSSTQVSLGALGTGVVEVPNIGPLTQGSVFIEAPQDVIGYGIFRQALQGVNPQEGVVPFSSSTATGAAIVFDDTDFVTAIAVLNPGSSAVAVTVHALDANGAEIGTFTLNLNPRQREAFAVRDRPEMTMVQGQRGVLKFSSSGGPVSVLGLRFNQLAFTSILPAER